MLATLGQFGIRTSRDIAVHAVMHKSTVSRAVSALEERGLVGREANPNDLREELLVLTDEGRHIYDALVPEALAFAERAVSVLSPVERQAFFSMVERLDRHARTLAPELEGEPPP